MRSIFLMLPLLLVFATSESQDLKIGDWRSHLNYSEGIRSEEVDNRIYCATKYGLFYCNKEDNSLVRLSKTEGMSEVEIETMGYDEESGILVVAYANTNLDLLKGNTVYNASDIYRKFISGKKEINHLSFRDENAYISTSFGIVVYDLDRFEVKETYSDIGENGSSVEVYSTAFVGDSIYAATSAGVRCASLNSPNLLDYGSWKTVLQDTTLYLNSFEGILYACHDGIIKTYENGKWSNFIDSLENECKEIVVYNNHLIITFSSKFFQLDRSGNAVWMDEIGTRAVLLDKEGDYWFTKKKYTLIRKSGNEVKYLVPNSQASQLSWDIEIFDDVVYVSAGSITSQWGPQWNFDGIYKYEDDWWTNYNYTVSGDYGILQDVITMAVRPTDGHLFAGSFLRGLSKINKNGNLYNYNQTNSTLSKDILESDSSSIKIAGLAFDEDNRLWVSNFRAEKPLAVFDNGTWKSYYLGSGISTQIADIAIDDYNQKWLIVGQGGGIIVFDETREEGDRVRVLKEAEGDGNLPSETVNAIELDLEGRMWIGTDNGIAVVYDPSAVFTDYSYDAQQIWIDDGDESGYLLASEDITSIAVDGADNKWIGSRNGVWYVNDDGTEIIYNFTKDNSPLPENYIRDIEVNHKTGEVFFATDLGLVSFRNYATEGGETHEDVYAFPNPVKPGYEGSIAVKGLVRDANVKITDIAGNLVYETYAEGGQATWDGYNFDGVKAKTGVYLIFSTNEDGTETYITKLMIIR